MLNSYLSDTRLLLNDSLAEIYTDAELTTYINKGRSQTALLGECVRDVGNITVTTQRFSFDFKNIISTLGPTLLSVAVNIRAAWEIASSSNVEFRAFEWFTAYVQNAALPASGIIAAIYRQGDGGGVNLVTGLAVPFTLSIDAIWLPVALVSDSTLEAISQPWALAIPYYAAWMAYMRTQRQADADEMLRRFEERLEWARRGITSSQLPDNESLGGTGSKIAASKSTLAAMPQQSR